MKVVKINMEVVETWDNFHDIFYEKFNFPNYYGRNMDAWIDCMNDLTDDIVVLDLKKYSNYSDYKNEFILAVLESAAFVNYRRVESGEKPFLIVSMS